MSTVVRTLERRDEEGSEGHGAEGPQRSQPPRQTAVELRCACGRRFLVDSVTTPDADPGRLVVLADGWGPLAGGTLQRWAKTGRLRAFRAERSKLVAWESDIRRAVEADRIEPHQPGSVCNDSIDDVLLSDPNLVAYGRPIER